MAVRADQSLVYGRRSGGHSDDKGRSARRGKTGDPVAWAICRPVRSGGTAKALLGLFERADVEPEAEERRADRVAVCARA